MVYYTMNCMNVGRVSEMLVAVDLMKRGYDVYFGYYSQYDMVAIKSEMKYTVEVKTGKHMKWDWIRFKYKADIYALVNSDGKIEYKNCYKDFT